MKAMILICALLLGHSTPPSVGIKKPMIKDQIILIPGGTETGSTNTADAVEIIVKIDRNVQMNNRRADSDTPSIRATIEA